MVKPKIQIPRIKKKERNRQIFHLILGLIVALLIHQAIITELVSFLIVVIGFAISVISKKRQIPVIYWFLKRFEREKDIKKFPGRGALYFFLGVFFTLIIFKKETAAAAVLIFAIVDTIPPLIGKYGKIPHPLSSKKYLEAALGGFIIAGFAATILIPWYQAALASLAAVIVEGIDLRAKLDPLDDNITVPLISALVIWLIRISI